MTERLDRDGHEVLIVIPAYNEEMEIAGVLKQLTVPPISDFADVLIVNDASQDMTNKIVKQFKQVAMITHIFNLGYGSALQTAYKYAVRRKYRYVIQMDADGQHDPSNVVTIYECLKETYFDGRSPDIVIGSRFMPGSAPFKTSFPKRAAISMFRSLIKEMTGHIVTDPTSGLQGLSRPAFLYYSFQGNFDDRYPDANMIVQMVLSGFRVKEVPAIMYQRTSGSSMHSGFKPIFYMMRMAIAMTAVWLRLRMLPEDKRIGLHLEKLMWMDEAED